MEKVLFDIRNEYEAKFFPNKDLIGWEDITKKFEEFEEALSIANEQLFTEDFKKELTECTKRQLEDTEYIKIDDYMIKLMEKVSEITRTDYGIKDDKMSVESLEVALEDVVDYYEKLQQDYETLEAGKEDERQHGYWADNYEDIKLGLR